MLRITSKSGPRAGQELPPDSPDLDQGDGQGFWNNTRTLAAEAMVDWLATDPTNSDDPDILIGGDTNTYANEDPLIAQEEAGYTPLFPKESYSFVFRGQQGSLDHVLANDSLLEQFEGATKWHTNVDEPNAFEYSQRFFNPDPFRSADHDPLLIGLNLTSEPPVTPEVPANVFGTPGNDRFDSELPGESGFVGEAQNLFTGSGNDTVDVSLADGGNRIDLGSDNDTLFAGTNNRILAGSGDDILFLGNSSGNNVVTGAMGADQFWIVTDTGALATNNTITDFTAGEDVIGFANTDLSFTDLTLSQSVMGGQTRTTVTALGEELAILLNVQSTALTEANFVFA